MAEGLKCQPIRGWHLRPVIGLLPFPSSPLKNTRTAIIFIPKRISSANVPKLSLPRRRSSALLSSGVQGGCGGRQGMWWFWRGGKAADWSNCNSDQWIRWQCILIANSIYRTHAGLNLFLRWWNPPPPPNTLHGRQRVKRGGLHCCRSLWSVVCALALLVNTVW